MAYATDTPSSLTSLTGASLNCRLVPINHLLPASNTEAGKCLQNPGRFTLPIINKSKWSALTVVIPPTLDEQLKIVADLDRLLVETMSLEAVYEQKLSALDELKKSLLHQAFNGQLTVKSTDQRLEAVT